jgi:signal transduction histidine kinase
VASASAQVRDELRQQAESLRQLMMAVQPLEVDRRHAQSLSAPIRAYIDGLYGDRRAPTPQITVDEDLVLDWSVETVLLRIVQEAVRNVWRHSRASLVEVTVAAEDNVILLTVADNGVGFDPAKVLFESGIGVMRSFALLVQGTLTVDSAPGRGTRVTARLGATAPRERSRGNDADIADGDLECDAAPAAPRLRLVAGGRASVGEV